MKNRFLLTLLGVLPSVGKSQPAIRTSERLVQGEIKMKRQKVSTSYVPIILSST